MPLNVSAIVARSIPADAPTSPYTIAVVFGLDVVSVGEQKARSGRPPRACGEEPGVAQADVPFVGDDHRAAETDAGAERDQRVGQARVVGAAARWIEKPT